MLKQININFDKVFSPKIDEYIKKRTSIYAKRMATEKMNIVKEKFQNDLILTADTVVYAGKRIIDKTDNKTEALHF